MKKTYIKPASLIVQLSSRSALMSVSGTDSLGGTRFGGTTEDNDIINADIKAFNNSNLWDDEW